MASVDRKVGYMDGHCGRLHVEDAQKRMIRERSLVKSERLEGGQIRR